MRTTIVRTIRSRGRRTHPPVAPAPDLAVLAPAGLAGPPPRSLPAGLQGGLSCGRCGADRAWRRRRLTWWCSGTPAAARRSRFFLIYQYT